MAESARRVLAVVGAGPKGIAVAVKAKVLEEFGLAVDRVVLIERHSVGAHWSGEAGFTDGEMKLGTSPEKDVVFPIETETGDPELDLRVRQRLLAFTWSSFLVQTGRFSDWVDRGRPAPCHRLWAIYLQWVSERLAPEVTILKAEVARIELSGSAKTWRLALRSTEEGSSAFTWLEADRLMLTGPGKPRLEFEAGNSILRHEGIFDLESFWRALKADALPLSGKLAIVGAGENAASLLLALSRRAPGLEIDVISPKGFISTRAENFYENRIYSQPERNRWKELALTDRVDFIKRTDLGVFSIYAMQILNEQARHRVIPGRLTGLRAEGRSLHLSLEYQGRSSVLVYDQVVLATGFDHVSTLRSLLSPLTISRIESFLGAPLSQRELTLRVREDLSIEGIDPPLHLPMLAGLMQGPGFSNLSCLGGLSDRIVLRSDLSAGANQGEEALNAERVS